jgi:hypothetical protein
LSLHCEINGREKEENISGKVIDMVTTRVKIMTAFSVMKRGMSSEEIFLFIFSNIDSTVRMVTVERTLYSMVDEGTLSKSENVYSLKSAENSLVWLEG